VTLRHEGPDPILTEALGLLCDSGVGDDVLVERVVLGVFFTGVKLTNGHAGVCYTPIKDVPEAVCCPSSAATTPASGRLRGRAALQVAEESMRGGPLRRAVGIATLNALSDCYRSSQASAEYSILPGFDPIDDLVLADDAHVVVVGALVPYLRTLKRRGKPFCVLEQDPTTLKADELPFYQPAARAPAVVPTADVLIATGTTLINGTLDGLLALARADTDITVVGPTASLLPDPLFRRGVNSVGGVRVTDPDALLDTLAEGGSGYHFFGKTAQKITLRPLAALVQDRP
jgi:uncharacterized protein (DUF4213/DUF364 family)